MTELKSLKRLINEFSKLPGIGEKTAQRLAYFVLKKGNVFSQSFVEAIQEVETQIHTCHQCFSFTESESLCNICENQKRDSTKICVVEEPFDIMKIESSQSFHGLYHVLHGTIAPLEGVQPDHLKIRELMERIDKSSTKIQEVILALDADIEGDTTALYLTKLLHAKEVKATRLAYGVPFGSDIDYIDKRTLGKAIENRVEL
ncbi:MAG: recombination mediator RecR [Bdellovibrionota bacterium]